MLSRLISTYALVHADYLWQVLDHLRPSDVRLVSSAVCGVMRRALGLHRGSGSDLVCVAVGIVPPRFRAAQLRVLCLHHSERHGKASRIRDLRESGMSSRSAAWQVWLNEAPEDILHRASAIKSLLLRPDRYSRVMARNIAWPSALR